MKGKIKKAVKIGATIAMIIAILCPCAFIVGRRIVSASRLSKIVINTDSDTLQIAVSKSNANHGDTLEEVLLGISNEPYEYRAVFYDEYKITEVTDYDENRVSLSFRWSGELGSKMIDVHNHPGDCPGSFSYIDLDSLFRYQVFGSAIVVTSEMKYTLSAPNGWPSVDALVRYFIDEHGISFGSGVHVQSEVAIDDRQTQRLCKMGYITFENEGIAFTSEFIAKIADYFGLVYTEEPLSDTISENATSL